MTRESQDQRWDRERDYRKHDFPPLGKDRNYAVAALVGECEAIAASGVLTEPAERSLRVLIAHTLAAFEMPSKTERVVAERVSA